MHNTAIVPGSIGAIAKSNRTSIAETFANADVVIIVDTSGSMHTNDSRGGKKGVRQKDERQDNAHA